MSTCCGTGGDACAATADATSVSNAIAANWRINVKRMSEPGHWMAGDDIALHKVPCSRNRKTSQIGGFHWRTILPNYASFITSICGPRGRGGDPDGALKSGAST